MQIYSVFTNYDTAPQYEVRWYGGYHLSIHDEASKDEIGIVSFNSPTYERAKAIAQKLFDCPELFKNYLSI